ncbi:glycosyltransferase family 4 protein [Methylocaldum sp. MU1018]
MNRILFISHDTERRGAELCLSSIASSLKDKFGVRVLLPWQGPLESELASNQVDYLIRYCINPWIPGRNRHSLRSFFRFARSFRSRVWSLCHLIEKEKADLVYTNTSTVVEGAVAARRMGVPHIWHVHEYLKGNQDLKSYLPSAWVDFIIERFSDRIIVPSMALGKRFGKTGAHVEAVPNGVDLARFDTADPSTIRSELRIPENAPIVTFIGGFSSRKDPLTFIRAAAKIRHRFPEARFLMMGDASDPGLHEAALHAVKDLGLEGRCHPLGARKDIPAILKAATVHVSTSRQEVFPLNLVEAAAAAKPVIATRWDGVEEVVDSAVTGLLVSPGDPDAVADAVSTLLRNPERLAAMGAAARERAVSRFSLETYADRIEHIIHDTLTPRLA